MLFFLLAFLMGICFLLACTGVRLMQEFETFKPLVYLSLPSAVLFNIFLYLLLHSIQ